MSLPEVVVPTIAPVSHADMLAAEADACDALAKAADIRASYFAMNGVETLADEARVSASRSRARAKSLRTMEE